MRGTRPAPEVPTMPTDENSDEPTIFSDGGARRTTPGDETDAPLVPDLS